MAVRVVARAFGPAGRSFTSSLLCSPLLSARATSLNTPLTKAFPTAYSFSSSFRYRSYATATVGIEDAETLVEREQFAKVRRQLEADTRKKISYKEFVEICGAQGLNAEQAKQLSQSLSDSGSILHFPNSKNAVLKDYVFLKPVEFNTTVQKILAHLSDDTYVREELAKKQQELGSLKAELQTLQAQRESLEKRAHKRANSILWAGFGYCVLQGALVARLTWWELSWDVMEPVTYMLTFAVVLIGYSYFVLTGSEYTFEGLRKTLERRKLAKLLRRYNFDEATFRKLQDAVMVREKEVQRLLEDLQLDPVSLHLKDPSRPIV
jgi:cell division protein FtsB